MLTESMLRSLWPHGDSKVPGLIAGIAAAAPTIFSKYGFNNDLVIAHAMAQFSHECGAGTEMVENTNYSAERAAEVWPLRANDSNPARHFANAADCYRKCKSWAGDPDFHRKLINLVYGTRMGNRPGTDDGWNLIGRGLPQTTGHDGYHALGLAMSLDLLSHPELVIDPKYALEAGCADFVICGCLPWAQKDNVLEVTKHLNGGTVGLDEREQWLAKWKRALFSDSPIYAPSYPSSPTGFVPYSAGWVQHALNALGFGPVSEDGAYGDKTKAAVMKFQRSASLLADGDAGSKTKAALEAAMKLKGLK